MALPFKSSVKLPAEVGAIGAQMGIPPGKKLSVKNMMRVAPAASTRKKRQKPGADGAGVYAD